MSSLSSRQTHAYYRGPPVGNFSSSGDSNHGFASSRSAAPRRSRSTSAEAPAGTMPPASGRPPPSLGQLNPEQQQRVYEEVLNSERPYLCKSLDPSRHFPYLKSKLCFDMSTQERINHRVTSVDKADAFIEEVLRGGLNAMMAFFESLEKQKVEAPILKRLVESCHTSVFRLFHEDAFADDDEPHRHRADQVPFDIVDEGDGDGQCVPGQLRSVPPGLDGAASYGLDGAVEDAYTPIAIPRVDIDCLRRAQGLTEADSIREGEEASDVSSSYELTSHGNQP